MRAGPLYRAARWLGLALALASGAARADTPVALTRSFAGNVNFTGTQVTLRTTGNCKTNNGNGNCVGSGNGSNNGSGSNGNGNGNGNGNKGNPCAVYSPATVLQGTLSGLPAGATVVSAQLYWAGSNRQSSADYTVTFEGADVTASAGRSYVSVTGGGFDYFGGAADVTAQVAKKGNGTYAFSGLAVSSGAPYCNAQTVLGGFSLLVVYSSASEPYRVLDLYEGFQHFVNSGLSLSPGNFLVPNPLVPAMTTRLGHITWEGDPATQGGEQFSFNGSALTDALNPAGNQFGAASSINGDTASYGIDFDAYTVVPSSGLIQPGQAGATTTYQTGQDLVLLSAEVVAVPSVPAADLAITMTRAGPLQAGRATGYTLSVRNAGPNADSGPVVVTDSVPAGMSYGSASGSGWSCAASGQAVTCSTPGPLAVGATLPALTLMLTPSAAGTYTNSATVRGQMFDNVAANSSASDTATAGAAAGAYAFTTTACQAGAALGSAGCLPFAGPVVAGAATEVYVTALSSGSPATATALAAGADTTLPLRFALACVDPVKNQGVSAVFGSATLALCADNGVLPAAGGSGWSAPVPLVFAAGQPSVRVAPGFAYEDVGTVTLGLVDASGHGASATFVARPARLAFSAVRRTVDGAPNPAPSGGARPGFARAGQAFTLTVGALTATGKWAPNFGNEQDARWWPQIRLRQVQERELPAVQGAFETAAGGFVTGTGFWWDEAGTLNLAPLLNDYQGAGSVDGDALDIGRFYPDHFNTAAFPAFPCLPPMACPAAVTGAAYSAQPFRVEVRAIGMTGKPLANYAGATLTLAAVSAAGSAIFNPAGGALADNGVVSAIGDPVAAANPRYVLPAMFAASQPRAYNWTAPATVFLRATAPESVVDATGTARPVTISSRRPASSIEGGLTIVDGRLQLANAFGSELLRLPVRMNAQFWTGTAWTNNSADNASEVAWAGNLAFTDCLGALATAGGGCDGALLAPGPAPASRLSDGAATFWLPAPGRGKAGSAWLRVNDGNPRWLPSTRARAVYGIYTSPLIYIREVH